MKLRSYPISFADRKYLVYNDGTIWSEFSNRNIKGKTVSGENKRLIVDIKVNGKKESLLINRLVFFFHYYNPKILKKENPTLNHFKKMPLVYHVNGDVIDNSLSNLKSMITRKMLGELIFKEFPEKFTQRKSISKIQGINANYCIRALKNKESYASIAKNINTSDMAVYRFAKLNNLIGDRSNGRPKLTPKQVLQIRSSNLSGKTLSTKFKVTETCISRVRRNKTYII